MQHAVITWHNTAWQYTWRRADFASVPRLKRSESFACHAGLNQPNSNQADCCRHKLQNCAWLECMRYVSLWTHARMLCHATLAGARTQNAEHVQSKPVMSTVWSLRSRIGYSLLMLESARFTTCCLACSFCVPSNGRLYRADRANAGPPEDKALNMR